MPDPYSRVLACIPGDATEVLDLANPDHQDAVRSIAEAFEALSLDADALQDVDLRVAPDDDIPVAARVALKLATSRQAFRQLETPVHVSVVFAVYQEHRRMLTAEEHPAGEDLVRWKLRQLRWLFSAAPHHSWDLTIVDDGCPDQSGAKAQAILNEFALDSEETRVLFLEDAIRDRLPIVQTLESTTQSQKGGSIRFGLWDAARRSRESKQHIALFTDADLSTHLGQIGLLASALAQPGTRAALGSRREASSVTVKGGTRNLRGKLFVYLWKGLIPQLEGIIDTQCGFKAFDAQHLATWIGDIQDNGFSFDIEFLLRIQLLQPGALQKVAVAWIDSEAESTTTSLEPYLPMLQRIATLYRSTLPATAEADALADLIERLDNDSFHRLVARLPPALADREPIEFDAYRETRATDLAQAIGLVL
ncbi:MAG: hypothetical protein AAF170_17000 [Bacteroidota bacterium]